MSRRRRQKHSRIDREEFAMTIIYLGKGRFDTGAQKPAPPPPPDPLLMRMLRDQTTGVGFADALPDGKSTHYVVGRNGLYLAKSSAIGTVTIKIGDVKAPILAAPEVKEAWIAPFPHIPFNIFAPVIAFLKEVKKIYDSEGLARFYYHDGAWSAYIPEQVVSSASVDVAQGVPEPAGIFAAEIHSHPGGSSTFSGTDDANEQMDRVFLCVAWPPNSRPSFTARVGTGMKMWLSLELGHIVDLESEIRIDVTPALLLGGGNTMPSYDFPAEWLERVSKRAAPVVVSPTYYRGPTQSQHQGGYNGVLNGTRYVNGFEVGPAWMERAQNQSQADQDHDQSVRDWLTDRMRGGSIAGLTESERRLALAEED